MILPNYKDGSIVNLMSSISKALGDKPIYKPLKQLNPKELSTKNIVLLFIDGLGYEFIKKNGKNTIFNKYLRGKITSVLPSATGACEPSFMTGVAPQQHAMTGWFVYLKEIGLVTISLPFVSRVGNFPLTKLGINPRTFFNQKSIFDKINVKSYTIMHQSIINSGCTIAMSGKSKRIGYKNLNSYFKEIKKLILSNKEKKFIYAYWGKFDGLCHDYGVKSKEVLKHFKELNKKLSSFLKSIEDTDTTIIIVSDHGAIDTEKSKIISLEEHPKFVETLTLPLCGEPRFVYCYVHPSKIKQFKDYIKKNFKGKCRLYRSEELIKKNYFGLFKPNKDLFDRVGDYILIMEDNYIMEDSLLGGEKYFNIGNHGGVSKEEMLIPLIVIKT
ncbi:alkaline phosphatase family protein [Candidatus Woesearchaeota archaeon]|nr:alkaline phosphatase family protein [Candidatus Woesearchaeota archaeon]